MLELLTVAIADRPATPAPMMRTLPGGIYRGVLPEIAEDIVDIRTNLAASEEMRKV